MIAMLQLNNGKIELVVGNIVEQETNAVVNAANTKLAGGGGVDGAIHAAAGPELLDMCLRLPADENGQRCPTGEVKTTPGANLKAKFVIHAVGPFYNEQYKEKAHRQLEQVHRRALHAAIDHQCKTIAFPAISTGAYRFPINDAADIAIRTVAEFLDNEQGVERVCFVLFKQSQFDVFKSALDRYSSNL